MAKPGLGIRARVVRIKVDRKAVVAPDSPLYHAVQGAAVQAVKYAQGNLIRNGSVKTGRLFNAVGYRMVETPKWSVIAEIGALAPGADSPGPGGGPPPSVYGSFVEEGTQTPIRSTRPDGVLSVFKRSGGTMIFRRRVAGQRAKPWLKPALEQVRKEDFLRGRG